MRPPLELEPEELPPELELPPDLGCELLPELGCELLPELLDVLGSVRWRGCAPRPDTLAEWSCVYPRPLTTRP